MASSTEISMAASASASAENDDNDNDDDLGGGGGAAGMSASALRLIDEQASLSANLLPTKSNNDADADDAAVVAAHLQHQTQVFDKMSDFFASEEATPSNVKPILRNLMKRILQDVETSRRRHVEWRRAFDEEEVMEFPNTIRILDVGCGTGVLFSYLVEAASASEEESGVSLDITGVDLSPQMIAKAQEGVEQMKIAGDNKKHKIQLVCGDFVSLALKEESLLFSKEGLYDAVIINACFGNFFDTDALVEAASKSLRSDAGMLFVTHPLGAAFVEKLHQEDATTVPHVLPPTRDAWNSRVCRHGLEAQEFVVEKEYFATARKTPHVLLPRQIKLRGPVAHGYGRGGKQLGFPTANLPSSLFAQALEDVPAGIYVGWAVVEDPKAEQQPPRPGRNVVQKAVVNVGYSPTFVGAENAEKIVEAHLMVSVQDGPAFQLQEDFYHETMRLVLLAHLRPERKFSSLEELIAAISLDVYMAKTALQTPYFQKYLNTNDFLSTTSTLTSTFIQTLPQKSPWIGKDGGNETASWEWEALEC